ncbi:hypothetical protein [Paenibacillus sp. RC67]|uniref:hypothetical protein n=1 Tax=Paenibacillus sp. RC67 TaxID=3039392 RepID=UPI0024ACD890|nr:hypothetical protein [Paenibacillus sp. RC67]
MVMSFTDMRRVPSDWLQERLETVKSLTDDNNLEMYEVAKDKMTGEHYLHYAYLHKQIAAIGPETNGEEIFHHLMPIDSDDVLGLVFGEQFFTYPDHWNKTFLRNGPDGDYVWFDPSYTEQEVESDEIGANLQEQLLRFKQSPERTEEAVRKLLEELDRTLGKDDNN